MARPLRIEYPGAIYHVMARGNHRQDIVQDDHDHQELVERLELTVERYGWLMYAFVMLTNHLHLLFCTPDANLSAGMQFYLSGYANWFQRRHGHIGHLFQGRFRGYIIEDESYFWNVSRYDHLNPLRTHPPLAAHPADWRWSSYPGYHDRRQRLDWVAYDRLLAAREADYGGADAYRRFVELGIETPPQSPFEKALDGWILGSTSFADRLAQFLRAKPQPAAVPQQRRFFTAELELIAAIVANYYDTTVDEIRRFGSRDFGRSVFVWLARRHNREPRLRLAEFLHLNHPDSVGHLIGNANRRLSTDPLFRHELSELRERILIARQS